MVTEPIPGRATTVLSGTFGSTAWPAILRLVRMVPASEAVSASGVADTLAEAVSASAVIKPPNRLGLAMVAVCIVSAVLAVLPPMAVAPAVVADRTAPPGPTEMAETVRLRVRPCVPPHGQPTRAELLTCRSTPGPPAEIATDAAPPVNWPSKGVAVADAHAPKDKASAVTARDQDRCFRDIRILPNTFIELSHCLLMPLCTTPERCAYVTR